MLEAVFISDLHLHPQQQDICKRFFEFADWMENQKADLYILGDFFHAWAGDDATEQWSDAIAKRLKALSQQGIKIYFMHGNRDFLVGRHFANAAGMQLIKEPYRLKLGGQKIVLAHGDRYCLRDKAHQRFRKLTRNRLFPWLFLKMPLSLRLKLVSSVRNHSQNNQQKRVSDMDIVPDALTLHIQQLGADAIIHGHIHKYGFTDHSHHGKLYQQIVLSDWDDSPQILCYDNPKGFYFMQINSEH